MKNEREVRWREIDPLNRTVELKNETYVEHIIGDHAEDDAETRNMLEKSARRTVKDPVYIILDPKKPATRYNYYSLVRFKKEDDYRIHPFKVVVEEKEDVFEVVTYVTERKVSQDTANSTVIYSKEDDEND